MQPQITPEYIQKHIADSSIIYQRGLKLYQHGAFALRQCEADTGLFVYDVDGNYGDYETRILFADSGIQAECNCPYPGTGCKHIVAVLLDAREALLRDQILSAAPPAAPGDADAADVSEDSPYLQPDEIRRQAIEDRKQRARHENFIVELDDTFKGEHLVETTAGEQYTVTLHDPVSGQGHCSCIDFVTNQLGVCKHLQYVVQRVGKARGFKSRAQQEKFPFIDIYWDSVNSQPKLFSELAWPAGLQSALSACFDEQGQFVAGGLDKLLPLLDHVRDHKQVRIQNEVFNRLDMFLQERQLQHLAATESWPDIPLRASLYPYQVEGVKFALYKKAALIGDEMGLGKTLQAIALAVLKKQVFDFSRVLIVTLASLKEQWKREIKRFCDESAIIVSGTPQQRRDIYLNDPSFFKITNYEAVLRDGLTIQRYKPDLVILDEAQRIKNFSTKTAGAMKKLPRKHALVLTGTPLENKLEDVYSIIQFLDPYLLTPLWRFAAEHFRLSRSKKNHIIGYHHLDRLRQKIAPVVIRRRKEAVLTDLPDSVINSYYIDLTREQAEIHVGYAKALAPYCKKKFLTPMDLRRIQELLLRMRQVCNSTYLIDRKTHISPKLKELESIIDEMVVQNERKMVIFSEWTTMTYLIARHLSDAGIAFVELSGKVPVPKRQLLIDEFTENPKCRVFLSTDAGGTGLNLQAADCVVNFELPWNPARLNQRIGRVNRIGQKSRCVNVVNLIAKSSIEERIMAGIQLKTDLFQSVFEGGADTVEFTREKRSELLNQLRALIDEEPVDGGPEPLPSEEIPEDAPHYLNPEVLGKTEQAVDYTAEENEPVRDRSDEPADNILAAQPPEKVEHVLNAGMQFIGGLMEMATGQKMTATAEDGKMINIDRQTGEITMRFKLPGF